MEGLDQRTIFQDHKRLVTVNSATYKGVPAYLLHYSNPPVQVIGEDGIEALTNGVNAANPKDGRFLVMYGDFDPLHAGADITNFQGDIDTSKVQRMLDDGIKLDALVKSKWDHLTTVGVLTGDRYGGSMEWPLMAKYQVADSRSKIQLSESLLGIIPGWNGIINVLLKAGRLNAEYLAKTGDSVNANQMLRTGLVEKVVEVGYPYIDRKGFARDPEGVSAYNRARLGHHIDSYNLVMPVALDLAITPRDKIAVYANQEGLELRTKEEIDEIVRNRTDLTRYDGIAGRSLKEVREVISQLGGRPISPDSVFAVDRFMDMYGDGPRELLLDTNPALLEVALCNQLMGTENRVIGVDAALKGLVPKFKSRNA